MFFNPLQCSATFFNVLQHLYLPILARPQCRCLNNTCSSMSFNALQRSSTFVSGNPCRAPNVDVSITLVFQRSSTFFNVLQRSSMLSNFLQRLYLAILAEPPMSMPAAFESSPMRPSRKKVFGWGRSVGRSRGERRERYMTGPSMEMKCTLRACSTQSVF
jgi:hypothetical protein